MAFCSRLRIDVEAPQHGCDDKTSRASENGQFFLWGLLIMLNRQKFDGSSKVANFDSNFASLCRLFMTTGGTCLMDKLASLEKHDERAAIALAAQMSMLARQALDEMRGIDAEFNIPSLAFIWAEVNFLGRMATKAQLEKPILGVPLPDLMAGCAPSELDPDFRGPLRAEIKEVWNKEPEGWRKHRLYKYVDTLSEHLFSFGAVLGWAEASSWGVVLQGCLDIPPAAPEEPEISMIVVDAHGA